MKETMQVRVARRIVETPDIIRLELRPADGGLLPPFSPGSHIDIKTPNGLVRQYSLCNNARETHRYVVGILRDKDSRGGSRSLHDEVFENTRLTISTPRNHFPLRPEKRSLLIAGGIGITPLLCMAEALAWSRTAFELHYFARSSRQAGFLGWIDQASFRAEVYTHFDKDAGQAGPDVQAAFTSLSAEEGRTEDVEVYICGPYGFIESVRRQAADLGVAEDRIHYELFSPPEPTNKAGDSFEVRLARSGSRYVIPGDKSITEVLASHGVHIPMSCEEGVCGTCITNVISGVPDHRDCFFSEQEKAAGNQMMPCCSRAKSEELVLDL